MFGSTLENYKVIDVWGGDTRWADLPTPAQAGLSQQIPVVDAFKPGDETGREEQETLALLDNISMPVTVIDGEKTMPVLKQVLAGLKARLPHAQVVEIESASHMVPLTHVAKVAEHLQATWAQ